jgi:hypothetical protein
VTAVGQRPVDDALAERGSHHLGKPRLAHV